VVLLDPLINRSKVLKELIGNSLVLEIGYTRHSITTTQLKQSVSCSKDAISISINIDV